jgi:hypothetical protein
MRIEKRVLPSEANDSEIYAIEWSNFYDAWIVTRASDSINAPIGTFARCADLIKTQYRQDKNV